jgi:CDP-glucose 4,6-dehydratase
MCEGKKMKKRPANSPTIQPSLFEAFYRGKSVFITGHTGFKGSWLALWLYELGAEVTGFALPPNTTPAHCDLIGLKGLVRHIEGDIRDIQAVKHAVDIAKPEIVFHLAAQALVRDSYDDPKTTFDTNIGGTVNILETIRHCPTVKAVVVVTSDKCYENKEWVWGYRESDPLGGHDPYSASKGAVEIVSAAYRRSYFDKNGQGPHLGLATARAGNVIGGGDWSKDRIIPDCVRALSQNKPIVLRNPQSTRPWQHVLDPLCGYLLLAKNLWRHPDHFSGAWNFGPGLSDQITVAELAEHFITAWGSGAIQTTQIKEKPAHEAHILHLCIDKAVADLKWQPLLDSSSSIDWTVNWYKSSRCGQQASNSVSLEQIRKYSQMVIKKGDWT